MDFRQRPKSHRFRREKDFDLPYVFPHEVQMLDLEDPNNICNAAAWCVSFDADSHAERYVPRPSVPVANNKAAPTGGGTKRNPGRQSHVITSNGSCSSCSSGSQSPEVKCCEGGGKTEGEPREEESTAGTDTGGAGAVEEQGPGQS